MTKIVPVTDYTFPTLEPEQKVLTKIDVTVKGHQAKTEDDVISIVKGHTVVITQFAPITRKVLETLAPGATIIRYGVGVDNIDLKAAKNLGIKVAYVPDYCMDEVADHTVSMILSLLRRLPMLDAGVRAGRWDGIQLAKPVLPFKETVVGLVGLGRIGREVVKRLNVFGCKFLVFDPYLDAKNAEELGVEVADLATVLKNADALSLHIPLSPKTQHFINQERLAQMKPTAILVNTARGGLVDTEALAHALNTKQLSAAALDVFEIEPLPDDSSLRHAPNLLLSPHLAWYSEAAIERLQRLAAEEAMRAVQGETLRCLYPLG